jgi:apyrase
LYGWISSNYINGTFRKKLPKRERSLQKSTIGALDMGGASMQIAFTHDGPIDNDYTLMADLFGDSYNVYSRSYLCYGVNEAVRRILAYSLMEAGINAQNISNPCLHTGDSMNYSSDSHYFNKQPCIEDVIPSGSLPNRTYMFIGTSDSTACQTLVAKAMNFSTELPGGSTIEYFPPNAKGRFYGFSNFYHIVDFFDVANLTMNNFEIFKNNVTDHCLLTWKQVRDNHDNTPTYLSRYCMEGTFVTYVLSDGFGFNSSNPDWSVHFTNKVDGLFVGWSLGYMLNQTNSITSDIHNVVYPYTLVDLVVGMIVLTILCLIFVVFFFFTFSACVKSLRPVANGYTNIA